MENRTTTVEPQSTNVRLREETISGKAARLDSPVRVLYFSDPTEGEVYLPDNETTGRIVTHALRNEDHRMYVVEEAQAPAFPNGSISPKQLAKSLVANGVAPHIAKFTTANLTPGEHISTVQLTTQGTSFFAIVTIPSLAYVPEFYNVRVPSIKRV